MSILNLKDDEKRYHEAVINLSLSNRDFNFSCVNEEHYAMVIDRMFSLAKKEIVLVIADWTDPEIAKLSIAIKNGIKPVLIVREHVLGPKPEHIAEYELENKIVVRTDVPKEKLIAAFEYLEKHNDGILTMVLVDNDGFTVSVRIRDLPQKVIRRMVNFHYDDAKKWEKTFRSFF